MDRMRLERSLKGCPGVTEEEQAQVLPQESRSSPFSLLPHQPCDQPGTALSSPPYGEQGFWGSQEVTYLQKDGPERRSHSVSQFPNFSPFLHQDE